MDESGKSAFAVSLLCLSGVVASQHVAGVPSYPPLFLRSLVSMTFFSTTITPTSAIQNIMTNKIGIRRVKQVLIRVRSMGDATVINVGGRDSQDVQLSVAGDAIGMDTPFGQRYLDTRTIYITSDGTTPVVEIFGDTYEV